MIIYIIRHGETRLNKEGRLQGQVDEPLNENGIKLARITGEALKKVPFDLMITSPLVRARKTGELVIAPSEEYYGRKIPVMEDSRLMEIDWGCWDKLGCIPANFELPAAKFNLFFSAPFEFRGSGDGEDILQVKKRTESALQDIIHNPEYQNKVILISTHGCAMRAMLHHLCGEEAPFWGEHVPYNCEMNILGAKDGNAWFLAKDQIYYDASLCFDHYKAVEE